MSVRAIVMWLAAAGLLVSLACDARLNTPLGGSAAIVGSISVGGTSGKDFAAAQLVCPDLVVRLNNNLVTVDLDDDCSFLVDDVQPAASVVLFVELPALGVSGTIELENVVAAELIEILVEADNDSLSISVSRRAIPDPTDVLPVVVTGNNVTILIPAGTYNQTLTVQGNNFTLVGVAGDRCDASGWSVITGNMLIDANNATFRNIRFDGTVEVLGNNAHFINSCFGSSLVIFGNNTGFDDDDDDDSDDDSDDAEDDDGGHGDDD
jgi:hypothetical protein